MGRTHFALHYARIQAAVSVRSEGYPSTDPRVVGRDISLEILRVEGYRKFCNKIFNATKFAMLKLDESFVPESTSKVCLVPRSKNLYSNAP